PRAPRGLSDPCRPRSDKRLARRPAGAVRRFQEIGGSSRIRYVWDRSVSRTACDPRGLKGRRMNKHVAISPEEAADRLAIRELIEAYARCADRRDAKSQMALFTTDTHFVVYMNAKDPTPSQELHSRVFP